MGSALTFSSNLKMGPVVAALGAIAAGTLVAATLLGQSLGPIPVDHPAIALQPGEGLGQPLVIEVNGPAADVEEGLTGVLRALAPDVAPLGTADDLFPTKNADRKPVTSLTEEERFEPVPPTEDLLTQVQKRISELVKAELAAPTHASLIDEAVDGPERDRKTKQRERVARSEPAATGRTSSESAPAGSGGVIPAPTDVAVAPVKEGDAVVKEALSEGAVLVDEVTQEAPPTAAGPASPVL